MPLPSYQSGLAREYLTSKGWQFRESGVELVLKTCPFCNKSGFKTHINNDSGAWICFHGSCQRKGNYFTLLREMGDEDRELRPLRQQHERQQKQADAGFRADIAAFVPYHLALLDDPETLNYLHSKDLTILGPGRGLTLETVKHFQLGVKEETYRGIVEDYRGKPVKWLMIPLIHQGYVVGCKYRALRIDGEPAWINPEGITDDEALREIKKRRLYQHKKGTQPILFGEDDLASIPKEQRDVLYMVEGEIDAMTLWQEGYQPVVSTSSGAGTFKTRWYDVVKGFGAKKLVICYDNDPTGQKAADDLLKKFADNNPVNVILPVKDANEFFATRTKTEFDALLIPPEEPELESCRSMLSVLDELETELYTSAGGLNGLPSQFPELNEMMAGGYWNGWMITVSAPAGTGKTSLVLQEMLWLAEQGIPTYFICLEMSETMVLRKIIEHKFGIPMVKQVVEDVARVRAALEKIPFFFGYNKIRTLPQLEDTVVKAVHRHDIKMVSFDNLHYFVRSIDKDTQEIALTTQTIKRLAGDLQIPMIPIAQPVKFDENDRPMRISDLKGSSSIAQDSDIVVLLHRQRIDAAPLSGGARLGSHSPFCLVDVAKGRYSPGGKMYLYFDGARSTYRALTEQERSALQQLEQGGDRGSKNRNRAA
jgi:hypothetical protein